MGAAALMGRTLAWTSRKLAQRVPQSPDNHFLQGRYAPVQQERTETALRVTGSIPLELRGVYARIGPNPFEVQNPGAYHWFLGDGMVHGLRLEDGVARWYRSRWVGTDNANRRLDRPLVPGPRHLLLDVVNTNVIGHGGRIWGLVEAGPPPAEMGGEFDTLRRGLFDGDANVAFSAHPHRDPETGELHAICYDPLKPFRVQHVVVDAQCQVTRIESVPTTLGPMIHDSALTASSVVILDLPVRFSPGEMLRGYPFPYRWKSGFQARVGLLPRKGKAAETRWFEVEPCFVFHTCNAWDLDDGGAVLDVVTHERMFDRGHDGPEVSRIRFERWTLDAASRKVQRKVISEANQEFPRCDERLNGKPYRYAYTAGFDHTDVAQPLYRHDLQTGRTLAHHYGPHHVTGEAVFVPRKPHGAEDDGWLMSYVYDLRERRSELVILNADDFEGPPQAVVHLAVPVPMGFHGNWIADAG